ncbi:hypothetical protein CBL_01748 [Carabus blaptoides fortunei]
MIASHLLQAAIKLVSKCFTIANRCTKTGELEFHRNESTVSREQCNQSGLYREWKRRGCTQAAQPLVDHTAKLNETFQVTTVDVYFIYHFVKRNLIALFLRRITAIMDQSKITKYLEVKT